ncbi:MAG: hypothetical protein AB1798_22345, partial [Spirochaetota bacterium]
MPTKQIQEFHNIKGVLLDVDGTLYHQAPLRAIMMLLLIFLNISNPSELRRKIKIILQHRKSQEILREFPEGQNGNQNNQILLTARHTKETIAFVSNIVEEWFDKRPLPFLRLCRRRRLE